MAEKQRVRVQAGRQGAPKQNALAKVPQRGLAAPAAPATLYEAILAAAKDPDIDADKLEKIVDVGMRVEANEARKAFARDFRRLKRVLPEIDKDGKIDHGERGGETTRTGKKALKARYSTYPNLKRVCDPLLHEHSFTYASVIEPSADGAKINVVGYLKHDDGHEMISRFPIGADPGPGRSVAQSWTSATSYAKRINFILMLDIVSKDPRDQDNDGYRTQGDVIDATPQIETISADQGMTLREAIESCGIPIGKFCKKYGIKTVGDLPADQFNNAIEACKHYGEEIERRRASHSKNDTFPGDN